MAMMDYGAIAWKDGKLISTDMFTPMIDTVGWHDDEINGNYFVTIGDKDFILAFYKSIMKVYNVKDSDYSFYNYTVNFGWEKFRKWKYWHDWFYADDDLVDIIVKPRRFHDYYVCKLKYRGHKYKVAFGYGVDLGGYKKWHMIDYYRIPWVRFDMWWNWHGRPFINKVKGWFNK